MSDETIEGRCPLDYRMYTEYKYVLVLTRLPFTVWWPLYLRGKCECVFRLPLPKSVETRNTKSSTQNYVQIHGTRTKLTHSMVQVYLDKD